MLEAMDSTDSTWPSSANSGIRRVENITTAVRRCWKYLYFKAPTSRRWRTPCAPRAPSRPARSTGMPTSTRVRPMWAGRRHAAVALDDRAHVQIAQVAVEAREDVGRVLHQRRELALALRERGSGGGQRGLRLHTLVDVADHGERAQRMAGGVAQQGDRRLDMHPAPVAAHVHRLRPARAARAQLLVRTQRAFRVGPALAEQVAAGQSQRTWERVAAVLDLGRRGS